MNHIVQLLLDIYKRVQTIHGKEVHNARVTQFEPGILAAVFNASDFLPSASISTDATNPLVEHRDAVSPITTANQSILLQRTDSDGDTVWPRRHELMRARGIALRDRPAATVD